MTTIAYRDGVMAADTAIWQGSTYTACAEKIARSPDGKLGGFAGDYGAGVAFRDWVSRGGEGDPPEFKDERSEGVVAYPDGRLEWFGRAKVRAPVEAEFYAIGSGMDIAMGAMAGGASAEQALAIAARLNAYTRGPITVLRHSR